jgi:uncharacterized protein (TIGR02444 family)
VPRIWDFALAFYQRPQVERDCLTAQDSFGLDVTALIFALYRAGQGAGFDAVQAVGLARTMNVGVVEPLRRARVALKSLSAGVDKDEGTLLRQKVKAVELEAERVTLHALDKLPVTNNVLGREASVTAIANATIAQIDPSLAILLKRLAQHAQTM